MIVCVDPGVVTLGYSCFKRDGRKPFAAGAFNIARQRGGMGSTEGTSLHIVSLLRGRLLKIGKKIETIYCEKMEFHSSARGIAAATDVFEVCFTCGVIAGLAAELSASFKAIPVSEWKGQLSKKQVVHRILKRWALSEDDPIEEITLGNVLTWPASHDWDSVGIGLHIAGVF